MLFTDIEGSTRLARAAGSLWPRLLAEHHALVLDAVERAGGHLDGSEGDALFAYFVDPSAAVEAAIAAQRALRRHAWPEPVGELRVRMGVHAGPRRSRRDRLQRPGGASGGARDGRRTRRPDRRVGRGARAARLRASSWSTWVSIGSRTSRRPSGSGCWCTTTAVRATSRRCGPSRCGRRTSPPTRGGSSAARPSSTRCGTCSPARSGWSRSSGSAAPARRGWPPPPPRACCRRSRAASGWCRSRACAIPSR